jgi:hypothetical protein
MARRRAGRLLAKRRPVRRRHRRRPLPGDRGQVGQQRPATIPLGQNIRHHLGQRAPAASRPATDSAARTAGGGLERGKQRQQRLGVERVHRAAHQQAARFAAGPRCGKK